MCLLLYYSVLQCVSSLLLCEKTALETATVIRMLTLTYSKDSVRHMSCVFTFTESLFEYSQLEKVITAALYCYMIC